MKWNTAKQKVRDGIFEFESDMHLGTNIVRYQTPSGQFKQKVIEVTA